MPSPLPKKRLIICCDGTWQNSDNGNAKSSNGKSEPRLQIPSNVTRISRCFKRTCSDGVFQIIYYQSGVGSRSGILDRLFGGAFGTGISENIREAYAFLCANYVNGDEIVLLGFSRGAFTARSIGGMVSDLGLLTRVGMEYFYPIFKDMQNWTNENYDDPFPTIPFTNKPKGEDAASVYRERLIEKGYSRARGNNGQGAMIRVLAIGVWDTVGCLGIPDIEILSRLGIKRCTHEYLTMPTYEFYNTHLSNKIQHGFHALALDEMRGPFTPTLWERRPQEQNTSHLCQVWFPGSHANIGGGWPDQGIADTTLAFGCEFLPDALKRAFEATVKYYTNRESESARCMSTCGACSQLRTQKPTVWAEKTIYESNKPVRPWSLHFIQSATGPLYDLLGSVTRAPGMYKKINPRNGRPLPDFLEDTNERIHPSVRYWRPQRVPRDFFDSVPQTADGGPLSLNNQPRTTSRPPDPAENTANTAAVSRESLHMLSHDLSEPWVWIYVGPEDFAPVSRIMAEETLGPFEKQLLELAAGKVPVYEYAERQHVDEFKAFHLRSFAKTMKRLHRKWHEMEKKAARLARRHHDARREQ
ncbi:hypothetical protein NUW58_g1148 [Xylaria curta]|uniref:Uncharacterized protein n=1 Tax=Xylaria curta TaxID=42375 RepID=A0ACC1PMI1_9PEZI|nr:hypothetical protein NUW58_g1148 [Xylaria curta]